MILNDWLCILSVACSVAEAVLVLYMCWRRKW